MNIIYTYHGYCRIARLISNKMHFSSAPLAQRCTSKHQGY